MVENENKAIEIIKGAILMENRGMAFYNAVAQATPNISVREIFRSMALEEKKHIQMLSDQYISLTKNGKMIPMDWSEKPMDFSTQIITKKIRESVSGAGYEAAAIGAALAMEEQAIKFYSARAETTSDKNEEELYQWLANWEKTHLDVLVAIDNELKEAVWFDNKFWPID
jgi:rubrerythrin